MYIVGITGASGSILGIRIIEELLRVKKPVSVIVSDAGWKTLCYELSLKTEETDSVEKVLRARGFSSSPGLLSEYRNDDLFAPSASGSTLFTAMIIAPLSMKSLASIANGYADSLLTRSADVALKEGRPLILVPRETPLNTIHLENLLRAKKAGAAIVPPMPGFYAFPRSIDDVVDFVTGKVLNLLGIEHSLFEAWG